MGNDSLSQPYRMTEGSGFIACRWTADDVRRIALDPAHVAPPIADNDFAPIDGIEVWDAWPVQDADGRPSVFAGGASLWMALAAPPSPDPDERHGCARI